MPKIIESIPFLSWLLFFFSSSSSSSSLPLPLLLLLPFSSLPLYGSLSLETQNIIYFDPPPPPPPPTPPPLKAIVWPSQIKPIFGLSLFIFFLVIHFPYFCKLTYVISTLASHLINSYLLGPFLQITILSNFRVPQFPCFAFKSRNIQIMLTKYPKHVEND